MTEDVESNQLGYIHIATVILALTGWFAMIAARHWGVELWSGMMSILLLMPWVVMEVIGMIVVLYVATTAEEGVVEGEDVPFLLVDVLGLAGAAVILTDFLLPVGDVAWIGEWLFLPFVFLYLMELIIWRRYNRF